MNTEHEGERPTRKVHFLVVSERFSTDELADQIGLNPDRAESPTDRDPTYSWEISAFGTGDTDLDSLIAAVLAKIGTVKERLVAVCSNDKTTCLLRIIQYVGQDRVGPGFGLEAEQIALLGDLHAFLDVDQYWTASSSGGREGQSS